tara:strand:- start:63 stop:1547 length:1485 start_codon:yes stop_codon:yes gene_type:complete
MPLIPLDIPAGFYRIGTDLDASGRWRDGSLVRWRDGSLRPVGGWQQRVASFSTDPIRGMHAWEVNNGTAYVVGGSHTELNVMTGSNTVTDVAPSDLATGRADAEVETGYGFGFYGTGYYGQPREDYGNYSEATTWSLDNWGEYLVACNTDDGRLLEWQLDPATDAAVIANAPTDNLGLIVTEERFIFALGAGGNPRKIQWCDREDNTQWTPLATNEAGDIELQTSGQIMTAVRTKGQTLLLTDVDIHSARYQGPPYVFGFQRVGTACGIISRHAAVDVDQGVFWMSTQGFYSFNGNSVVELPCAVHDYVFSAEGLNPAQQSKVWAWNNGQNSEIWWFFPSQNSTEIDRYVAFDYKENHWLIGELPRTSGVQRGIFKYPFMMGDDLAMYEHEVGFNMDGDTIFAETAPVSLGTGEQIMSVTKLIPDEVTQGDVTLTFKTRLYPNAQETIHGPFDPSNPTSLRFTGRQARMRIEGDQVGPWRVGTMRVEAKPMGKR